MIIFKPYSYLGYKIDDEIHLLHILISLPKGYSARLLPSRSKALVEVKIEQKSSYSGEFMPHINSLGNFRSYGVEMLSCYFEKDVGTYPYLKIQVCIAHATFIGLPTEVKDQLKIYPLVMQTAEAVRIMDEELKSTSVANAAKLQAIENAIEKIQQLKDEKYLYESGDTDDIIGRLNTIGTQIDDSNSDGDTGDGEVGVMAPPIEGMNGHAYNFGYLICKGKVSSKGADSDIIE